MADDQNLKFDDVLDDEERMNDEISDEAHIEENDLDNDLTEEGLRKADSELDGLTTGVLGNVDFEDEVDPIKLDEEKGFDEDEDEDFDDEDLEDDFDDEEELK